MKMIKRNVHQFTAGILMICFLLTGPLSNVALAGETANTYQLAGYTFDTVWADSASTILSLESEQECKIGVKLPQLTPFEEGTAYTADITVTPQLITNKSTAADVKDIYTIIDPATGEAIAGTSYVTTVTFNKDSEVYYDTSGNMAGYIAYFTITLKNNTPQGSYDFARLYISGVVENSTAAAKSVTKNLYTGKIPYINPAITIDDSTTDSDAGTSGVSVIENCAAYGGTLFSSSTIMTSSNPSVATVSYNSSRSIKINAIANGTTVITVYGGVGAASASLGSLSTVVTVNRSDLAVGDFSSSLLTYNLYDGIGLPNAVKFGTENYEIKANLFGYALGQLDANSKYPYYDLYIMDKLYPNDCGFSLGIVEKTYNRSEISSYGNYLYLKTLLTDYSSIYTLGATGWSSEGNIATPGFCESLFSYMSIYEASAAVTEGGVSADKDIGFLNVEDMLGSKVASFTFDQYSTRNAGTENEETYPSHISDASQLYYDEETGLVRVKSGILEPGKTYVLVLKRGAKTSFINLGTDGSRPRDICLTFTTQDADISTVYDNIRDLAERNATGITIADKTAIMLARTNYDALSSEKKAMVTDTEYQELVNAEKAYRLLLRAQNLTTDQEVYSVTYGTAAFNLSAVARSNGVKTNAAITYASDNKQVASVDAAGNVTAVGIGKAKITVTANGNEWFDACTTVVTVNVTKGSQSITLKPESQSSSFRLNAGTSGDGALTYRSSDTAVAKVDRTGTVTVVGAGTVKFTVTAASTNHYNSAVKTYTMNIKAIKGKTYTVKNIKYKVTSASTNGNGTVAVTGMADKTKTSVKIGNTVQIGSYSYKITAISEKAFYNNKKLAGVSIGKNVKTIGKNAFSGCSGLKTLQISSAVLQSVGSKAISGTYKKLSIKVPSSKLKVYKNLFTSATGFKQSMTVKKG